MVWTVRDGEGDAIETPFWWEKFHPQAESSSASGPYCGEGREGPDWQGFLSVHHVGARLNAHDFWEDWTAGTR